MQSLGASITEDAAANRRGAETAVRYTSFTAAKNPSAQAAQFQTNFTIGSTTLSPGGGSSPSNFATMANITPAEA